MQFLVIRLKLSEKVFRGKIAEQQLSEQMLILLKSTCRKEEGAGHLASSASALCLPLKLRFIVKIFRE